MFAEEVIADDQRYILQVYPRPNFVVERGEGCYLIDTEGRRYLDCVAGIAVNALGYGDAEVSRTVAEQAARLIHTSNLYYTRPSAELAKSLVEHSFADRVFFTNSGAEFDRGRAQVQPQVRPRASRRGQDCRSRVQRLVPRPHHGRGRDHPPREVPPAVRAADAGSALCRV